MDTQAWTYEGSREELWDLQNQHAGLLIPVAVLTPGDYRLELRRPGDEAFFSARFRVLGAVR